MNTITIDQLARELGITKASLISRIKNFYKDVWPPSCGKYGNSLLFDKELIYKCLDDNPYYKTQGGQFGNTNRNGKKNKVKIEVELDKDYLKFLLGRKR